jgi:hypothetical protein
MENMVPFHALFQGLLMGMPENIIICFRIIDRFLFF